MTKDLKFELVVKEILVGLGLGLLGVVAPTPENRAIYK